LEQLQSLGAHREALATRLEWLAVAVQVEDEESTARLLDLSLADAKRTGEVAYLAELLSRYSADLIQSRADTHFDLLSGEFYPPDLYGEGIGPTGISLNDRLKHPVSLMGDAQRLAEESSNRLAELRVSTTMLGIIYESRERFAELLDRWMPLHAESQPVRLSELLEALENGFFGLEQVEALTERVVRLAGELELDQAMADTIYEALDRELPQAMKRRGTLFTIARTAYERIGDTYGLITLSLVEVRHADQLKQPRKSALDEGLRLFSDGAEQLSAEQRAFIHLRFGEMLLKKEPLNELGCNHLERSLRLYDEVGDVEHVQVVGEMLREIYRKRGDFGGYRSIRERFRGIDPRSPGIDPLGLEIRIEHLLSKARQENDDEEAIAMVERCVQLFGRIPDGTTRIDECFVEISKICRRRGEEAFEAGSEAGFQDWLRRSLDAVRIAASINRSLGNYYRVFEEYHELFDDLIQLGLYEDYLRVRAENRELAFAVGNVAELLYLFEEHLQYDAETGEQIILLAEVRGFYEALVRYLLGLGAVEQALAIQSAFVAFLTALSEVELAEHYRGRTLFH
jgi:tetratricopeptide (TPR) repeat protein